MTPNLRLSLISALSAVAAGMTAQPLRADVTLPPLPAPPQAEPAGTPPPPVPIAGAGDFESPPVLDAAAILLPQYAQGSHHTVRPEVPTYAGRNSYTLDSEFGVFYAEGNSELVKRVAEINAIAKLREISKSETYGKALEAAAKSPLKFAGNLATHPVKTITGVPKGIFKFLNRTGQAITEATEGREPSPYEDNTMESAIGFSKAKREMAAKLGVDPYSSNEMFQKELNGIVWAAYAGNLTLSVALAPVGGAAGSVITGVQVSDMAAKSVLDHSPGDLRRLHQETLEKMGIPATDITAFLNNSAYSPTYQADLVTALREMPGVTGRDRFVQAANQATDEADALFFERSAHLMAAIHQTTPVTAIYPLQGLPVCLRADGVVVVPLEWDYACWTAGAAAFLQQIQEADFQIPITGHQLVITGSASPRLKAELAARQVGLKEKGLPGPLR